MKEPSLQDLFNNFKKLFEERLSHKTLLSIGEDSIRYDFFIALSQTYNLKPYQIEIEVPLNANCFVPKNNSESKRNEKPMIDLVVKNSKLKICAEFGLFRQNTNEKGTINKTARTIKMINDMVRASLESKFSDTKGYFICVADNKILGHKMRNNFIEKFPSNYEITNEFLEHQLEQKTNKIDIRFLNVFMPMNKKIISKIVYNQQLSSKYIKNETRIIIWQTQIEK